MADPRQNPNPVTPPYARTGSWMNFLGIPTDWAAPKTDDTPVERDLDSVFRSLFGVSTYDQQTGQRDRLSHIGDVYQHYVGEPFSNWAHNYFTAEPWNPDSPANAAPAAPAFDPYSAAMNGGGGMDLKSIMSGLGMQGGAFDLGQIPPEILNMQAPQMATPAPVDTSASLAALEAARPAAPGAYDKMGLILQGLAGGAANGLGADTGNLLLSIGAGGLGGLGAALQEEDYLEREHQKEMQAYNLNRAEAELGYSQIASENSRLAAEIDYNNEVARQQASLAKYEMTKPQVSFDNGLMIVTQTGPDGTQTMRIDPSIANQMLQQKVMLTALGRNGKDTETILERTMGLDDSQDPMGVFNRLTTLGAMGQLEAYFDPESLMELQTEVMASMGNVPGTQEQQAMVFNQNYYGKLFQAVMNNPDLFQAIMGQ